MARSKSPVSKPQNGKSPVIQKKEAVVETAAPPAVAQAAPVETSKAPPVKVKKEAVKAETAKAETGKKETVKKEAAKTEAVKKETRKPATAAKAESRPSLVPANLVPINLEEEVRRRAYELSERRGFAAGHEAEDWLVAEQEVRQRYQQQEHSA